MLIDDNSGSLSTNSAMRTVGNNKNEKSSGLMSNLDILDAINNHEMLITPFNISENDGRLTPSGFNFSFSRFIVSLNKKRFCEIIERESELYFTIEPGDTALILTRESIWVSKCIGGTFHSKVTYAAKGLGNVSTTLDPGWNGQLLISVNNPNKKSIKIIIGKRIDSSIIYETFITLCLYRLSSATDMECLNKDSRLEDLNVILQKGRKNTSQQKIIDVIASMMKYKSSRYTPDLNKSNDIEKDINNYIKSHIETLNEWEQKYDEIQVKNKGLVRQKKISFFSYIITFSIIIILFLLGIISIVGERENLKWLILLIVTLVGGPLAKALFDNLKKYY